MPMVRVSNGGTSDLQYTTHSDKGWGQEFTVTCNVGDILINTGNAWSPNVSGATLIDNYQPNSGGYELQCKVWVYKATATTVTFKYDGYVSFSKISTE